MHHPGSYLLSWMSDQLCYAVRLARLIPRTEASRLFCEGGMLLSNLECSAVQTVKLLKDGGHRKLCPHAKDGNDLLFAIIRHCLADLSCHHLACGFSVEHLALACLSWAMYLPGCLEPRRSRSLGSA